MGVAQRRGEWLPSRKSRHKSDCILQAINNAALMLGCQVMIEAPEVEEVVLVWQLCSVSPHLNLHGACGPSLVCG